MMISETILRRYIREIFLEASRVGMPAGELSKPKSKYGRPYRFEILLLKIQEEDWFTISLEKEHVVDGEAWPEQIARVIILKDDPHNQEIIAKIKSLVSISGKDQSEREEGARELQAMVAQQKIKVQIMDGLGGFGFIDRLGQIIKTGKDDLDPHEKHGFKRQGKGGSLSLGIISEKRVVEDINLALQGAGAFSTDLPPSHPLTVVLLDENGKNNITLNKVTSAAAAGTQKKGGVTSKSDVDITYDGGSSDISISMKMINAGHWLSADSFFLHISQFIDALLTSGVNTDDGRKAFLEPDGEFVKMVVEDSNGNRSDATFTLPDDALGPNFMQHATFGSGENKADVILKGDYWADEPVGDWDPLTKTLTISGGIYKSLEELKEGDLPKFIITGSKDRKKSYISPPPAEGDSGASPALDSESSGLPKLQTVRGLRFQVVIASRVSKAVMLDWTGIGHHIDSGPLLKGAQLPEALIRQFVREMLLLGSAK